MPYSLLDLAQCSVGQVYERLGVSQYGLTSAEAEARLTTHGRNVLKEARKTPLLYRFLANFVHLMALLLWAGGALAFVAQMPQLGIAIWIVVFINAVFSFWQEYKAEKATEALKSLLPAHARVLRDGAEVEILAEEVVPGDVLLLAEGDNIPADGRFVEESEVRTNNATLTGESTPVRKMAEPIDSAGVTITEMRNLAFAGTSIASGNGKVVVANTGMDTQFGLIAHMTQAVEDPMSPLQKEMIRVTRIITVLAVFLGVVFFIIGAFVVRMELAAAFIFAIGIIVANVPEGLLPTVTLALAMGVQRMARRNALIKKLSSVETLGSTTVICTDKTGTLTQNAMTVREAWTLKHCVRITGAGYEPTGLFLSLTSQLAQPVSDDMCELLRAGLLCNNARLLDGRADGKGWSILGDPTEGALVVAAAKAGITLQTEKVVYPRLYELPFESRRKCMSTVHRHGSRSVAFVKGAPNEIVSACTHVVMDGQTQPIDDTVRRQIREANDAYARGALRVLAVARRDFDAPPEVIDAPSIERNLTFLGLLAMMDPPRPEVAEAVERCHSAGIRTVMVTGDYGLTAASIANRIGLVSSANVRIVTGAELEDMADETLKAVLDDEVIFARVAPEHKLRVVSAFQDKGHIVAVTGDGVNDAPALKRADIGVAMGISGTDVAKEAADMILTDDNFASIVNAIEEGRGVYDNIKKFVTYILASNIPELIPFIAMALFNLPLALTVMQILAVDLGTDMLPALALGTEPPERDVMRRPPRSRHERLLNRHLLARAYLWLGMIENALCYVGFFALIAAAGYSAVELYVPCADLPAEALRFCANGQAAIRADLLPYSIRFATDPGFIYVLATSIFHMGVIIAQVGNAYACRLESYSVFVQEGWKAGLRWLFSNRFLLLGIVVEILLINVLVYVPPFQGIFEEGPVPPQWWLLLMGYAPALFLLEEARKAVVRRRARRQAMPALKQSENRSKGGLQA